MTLSDTVSATASTATLPIIISFTSNSKTRKTQNIQDFLHRHPNCQKYVKKGPNFVADGVNEFRLYYVDSSLFDDGSLLKKLYVEKEEIVFGSTSCNSSHADSPIDSCIMKDVSINKKKHSKYTMIQNDKGVMCSNEYTMEGFWDSLKPSKIVGKVSKSFQVGSDLCLNVVFVNNGDSEFYSSTQQNFIDSLSQTAEAKQTVPTSIQNFNKEQSVLLEDESRSNVIYKFKFDDTSASKISKRSNLREAEETKPTKSKSFDSQIVKTEGHDKLSETNMEFSIKSSPSFLANYVFQILKDKKFDHDCEKTNTPEISLVNYMEQREIKNYEYFKKMCKAMSDDSIQYSRLLRKTSLTRKSEYPINKYKCCDTFDKSNPYYQKESTCCKLECIFKYTGDSLWRKSQYAILKKYHRNLKNRKNKRHGHSHRCKNENVLSDIKRSQKINCDKIGNRKKITSEFNVNRHLEITKIPELCSGESKTTISEFLHSYQPCQWKNNSKLSVCIDEECMTE